MDPRTKPGEFAPCSSSSSADQARGPHLSGSPGQSTATGTASVSTISATAPPAGRASSAPRHRQNPPVSSRELGKLVPPRRLPLPCFFASRERRMRANKKLKATFHLQDESHPPICNCSVYSVPESRKGVRFKTPEGKQAASRMLLALAARWSVKPREWRRTKGSDR